MISARHVHDTTRALVDVGRITGVSFLPRQQNRVVSVSLSHNKTQDQHSKIVRFRRKAACKRKEMKRTEQTSPSSSGLSALQLKQSHTDLRPSDQETSLASERFIIFAGIGCKFSGAERSNGFPNRPPPPRPPRCCLPAT